MVCTPASATKMCSVINVFFTVLSVLSLARYGFGQGTQNMTELCGSHIALTNSGGTWYYLPDIQECIFVATLTNTWESGEMECLRRGAHLAVLTPENAPAISNLIKSATLGSTGQQYFIGLRISDFALGEYMWIDYSPLTYTNWATNQPASDTNHGIDYCVMMSSADGKWSDRECVLSTRYFCQRKAGEGHGPPVFPTRDPQGRHGGCKEGWVSFGPHCYYISPDRASTSWANAQENCKDGPKTMKNANLASILSSLENDFIITQLKGRNVNVWTGLHETQANIFQWADHHRYVYNNWHYQHPRYSSQLECIAMLVENNKVGRWVDRHCIDNYAYVCKAPKDFDIPEHQAPPNNCSTGFEQYGDACFQVISLANEGEHTWSHAQELCNPKPQENWAGGGGLGVITDVYENAFIRYMVDREVFRSSQAIPGFNVSLFQAKAWIGMREEYGHFKWRNNCPAHFVNLDSLLGNVDETACIDMDLDGKWHPHNCSSFDVRFAVCERRFVPCPSIPSEGPELCPVNFPSACANHCYVARSMVQHIDQNDLVTFAQARQNCIALGGDLATIKTEEQQKCVHPYAQYAELGLWIGLQNVGGGFGQANNFHWVDQYENAEPPTFVNWIANEPNGYGAMCAEMYPNGYWNDAGCNELKGYICQAVKNRTAYSTDATQPPQFRTTPDSRSDGGLSGGQIAGIVIGALLCVAIVGAVAFVVVTGKTSSIVGYFGGSSSRDQGSVKFTPQRFRNPVHEETA